MTRRTFGRVLVTGGGGMVGAGVAEGFPRTHVIMTGPNTNQPLDVTDPDEITDVLKSCRPDWVLHLAAKTNLEACEQSPDTAIAVNVTGALNMSSACAALSIPIAYVSSSAVFDGEKTTPYHEDDCPGPMSVYGNTKLLGERAVARPNPNHLIVRTSWLFGSGERDCKFVGRFTRMVLTASTPIDVVTDRFGSPTHVSDLLVTIGDLISRGTRGVVHVANEGVCSRHDLALEICRVLRRPLGLVKPVSSSTTTDGAPRPRSEALQSRRLPGFGIRLRPWQEALQDYLVASDATTASCGQ